MVKIDLFKRKNRSSCLVLKKKKSRRQNKAYKNKKNNQSIDLLVNYLCSLCASKRSIRFFSITLYTLEKLIISTNVTGLANVYLPLGASHLAKSEIKNTYRKPHTQDGNGIITDLPMQDTERFSIISKQPVKYTVKLFKSLILMLLLEDGFFRVAKHTPFMLWSI